MSNSIQFLKGARALVYAGKYEVIRQYAIANDESP